MNEVEMNILEIDNKKYFLIDSLSDSKNTYSYFSNVENVADIKVLKDIKEDEEEFLVSLDNKKELDYALDLYYQKHSNNL